MDVLIKETGNGGDLVLKGNDIAMVQGIENMPYLSMFSGDGNYWGNTVMQQAEPDIADTSLFGSNTEQVMNSVALNSDGIKKIEQAIKKDLEFITDAMPDSVVDVVLTLVRNNRLDINITINGSTIYYEWNPDSGFLNYKV